MKISGVESSRAAGNNAAADAKILPENRPKGHVAERESGAGSLSPLEQGMAVAEAALKDVPDTREDYVNELKEKIRKGEYSVSGEEIAEMMLRRRAADRIR